MSRERERERRNCGCSEKLFCREITERISEDQGTKCSKIIFCNPSEEERKIDYTWQIYSWQIYKNNDIDCSIIFDTHGRPNKCLWVNSFNISDHWH